VLRRHPDDDILSYARIKSKIAELSGVVPIVRHMCLNSCIAFTGPFDTLTECPMCHEARYIDETKKPRREFHTIPIGPQLQALWRTKEGAQKIRHRRERTAAIMAQMEENGGHIPVYDDLYLGSDYIAAVTRGDISPDDMVLILSIDGAQLYQNKLSDCWISIWIIADHSPDFRYKKKHVLPGTFIPGPNKPKHPDSFLFPGLHHLAALQKEGLKIWDASEDRVFKSFPYLLLATADGPGMTYLNGLVGHSGAYGCRLYCPTKGRHKPGTGHYYPAMMLPENYTIAGCDHPDIDVRNIPPTSVDEYSNNLAHVMHSRNETQFKTRRKETGIAKPSLFSGLPANRVLPIPGCFPADLMHLVSLNLTDLLLCLWRGTLDCDPGDSRDTWDWAVLKGETWKVHGKQVADATPYLPGSFDRPPCNPAEKISSGYKAWEFLMYVFALGPGVFLDILPDIYYLHFCKLVAAIRLLHQRSITPEQLLHAHKLLISFAEEFETLYYQRKVERLHFCRQSLHALLHMAPEVVRVGPGVYYTQWTMERTIGNLGEEIHQPSNPFANLSQRGIRRSQINALKAMIPDLERDLDRLPRGANDIGDRYVFLRARDATACLIDGYAGAAICEFYQDKGFGNFDGNWFPHIVRWARLRLPNGQIARSAWKEKLKPLEQACMARNIKVFTTSSFSLSTSVLILLYLQFKGDTRKPEFGEVQFFFRTKVGDEELSFALISVYTAPDATLLVRSHGTLWSCEYRAEAELRVIPAKSIISVVAMVPHKDDHFFVTEKLGLEVAYMGGVEEEMTEDE
jgi:hypothetical protein